MSFTILLFLIYFLTMPKRPHVDSIGEGGRKQSEFGEVFKSFWNIHYELLSRNAQKLKVDIVFKLFQQTHPKMTYRLENFISISTREGVVYKKNRGGKGPFSPFWPGFGRQASPL